MIVMGQLMSRPKQGKSFNKRDLHKEIMKKEGQTWSVDAIVAVAVFVVAVIAFFWALTYLGESQKLKQLAQSGESLSETVSVSGSDNSTRIPFVQENNVVNEEKLMEFSNKSYEQLKNELGLVHDFCIHFEDEYGNLINISPTKAGIGSSKVKLNVSTCG